MGRRRSERQEPLFVTAENLPKSAGPPFYKALNRLLAEANFDRWIEDRCLRYDDNAQPRGQKSIPPGVYFRMLPVGYFEGIDSQRGINMSEHYAERSLSEAVAVMSEVG